MTHYSKAIPISIPTKHNLTYWCITVRYRCDGLLIIISIDTTACFYENHYTNDINYYYLSIQNCAYVLQCSCLILCYYCGPGHIPDGLFYFLV